MNVTKNKSLEALSIIREIHDTTKMSADDFCELATAICFYLKGGHSPRNAAMLAAEEVFPVESVA